MTQTEQKRQAKEFAKRWTGHGYEKGEAQKFWLDLLSNVFEVRDFADYVQFEAQIKEKFADKNRTITNFVDVYIPSTRVMIEQKSSDKDLRSAIKQSDGSLLTPFQQAKRYVSLLPLSMHPRYIITCNFKQFLIYDMERPNDEPEEVLLKNLDKEIYRLQFIVSSKSEHIRREEEISLKAGELVGLLYDSLYKEYIAPNAESLRSLNILCVRIVFCLYAEDSELFETKTSFEDYLKQAGTPNMRRALADLFKSLDTPLESRDKYDVQFKPFPYINGGLFKDENIEIPNFTEEIANIITEKCANFNWSEISPTIFGAVFESTLNPETRRSGGMHYTSIENIHKVIDPLFLDSLKEEFEKIKGIGQYRKKTEAVRAFQKKISSLRFLDPACGSGNFLTESYLSLARLEIEALKETIPEGEWFVTGDSEVNIHQFYGIEINDFAVTVAKTALWISEIQMKRALSEIKNTDTEYLPLRSYATITEGNALRLDWDTFKEDKGENFIYADKLNVYKTSKDYKEFLSERGTDVKIETTDPGFTEGGECDFTGEVHDVVKSYHKELNVITKELKEIRISPVEIKRIEYDYIMGNPPFVGFTYMSSEQKDDMRYIFKNVKNLDYVCSWFKKASDFIQNKKTKCAFVSTNSITQGETVSRLFPLLNVKYDFAYKSFAWNSESALKAQVHCVIIGFSAKGNADDGKRYLFNSVEKKEIAKEINPYLLNAPVVIVESRNKPLCPVSKMVYGNKPADGGFLIIEEDAYDDFIKKDPDIRKYIRPFIGAVEFLHNKKRWCLWLEGVSPSEIKKCLPVYERVKKCKEARENSIAEGIRKFAETPHLFAQRTQPQNVDYIVVPRVSSENRRYVPIGFMKSEYIASDAVQIVPNATLYEFGVLTSNVHMAWMRVVCGRLKSDYRYSKDIVYNNFPWPEITAERKERIERTAQRILDARALYPEASLSDLYDEVLMPSELRRAHQENDKAVMEAYGFSLKTTESECVAELFKLYQALVRSADSAGK